MYYITLSVMELCESVQNYIKLYIVLQLQERVYYKKYGVKI